MNVCVFCASSSRISSTYVELAAQVGAALAARGHTVVSGGGSVSCMGALVRAARAGGARTIGIIPDVLVIREVADTESNELVHTPDMRSRKGEMDRRADAFLVLPGGLGTLEELFEVWVGRVLGLHVKPLVVLDPDGTFAPLRAQIDLLVERGFARAGVREAVAWARTVDAAVAALETVAHERLAPSAAEVLEAEP